MAEFTGSGIADDIFPVVAQQAQLSRRPVSPGLVPAPNDFESGTSKVTVNNSTPIVSASHSGAGVLEEGTPGSEWFDRVHILPKTPLDFGNVITTASKTFEIFNAFRQAVELQSLTNNLGTGVSVPDLPSLPTTLGAYVSLLDPTSTRFTPVLLDVQVTPDGAPTIDGTLDFLFVPGGTVMITVQANRITFLFPTAEFPFDELEQWSTDILEAYDGSERNRISQRADPVTNLTYNFKAADLGRRLIQTLMHAWQGRLFAVALREQGVTITQAVSSGTTVNVQSTTDVEFRDEGLCVLVKKSGLDERPVFDVLGIDAIAASSLTLKSDVTQSFDVGDEVFPVRLCFMDGPLRGRRRQVTLAEFSATFRVDDNETGALTGDLSPFETPTELGSKLLLDEPNIGRGGWQENYDVRVSFIDSTTGLPFQEPLWPANKRTSPYEILARTRAQILRYRRMFRALRGSQKSFYIGTKIEDLVVTTALSASSDQMVVENIDYNRFVGGQRPKLFFRITFTDGTSLIRSIASSVETSNVIETLTLNDVWPATRQVSEIQRVEWLEESRISDDSIRIRHEGAGKARFRFTVLSLLDD